MSKQTALIVFVLFFGLDLPNSFAQSQWFKFGITAPGVYKITANEAKKKGFQDLSEVAVFGYPGMLPQVLDSSQLSLQEIPTWRSNDALFFFLEGPNQLELNQKGEILYIHHHYTDTLHYLLGKSPSPKKIRESRGGTEISDSGQIWYALKSLKEEKNNLINSGRSWYSDPIRQGQTLLVNFGPTPSSPASWLVKANLMAQSGSSSQIRIFAGNEPIGEVIFNPVPASTYGIKGREQDFQLEFTPAGNRLNQLRFQFQGNGSGYLDYAAIGIPVSANNLSDGIYHGKTNAFLEIPAGKQVWEISDFFQPVSYFSGGSAFGKKWVIFSTSSVTAIQNLSPISAQFRAKPDPELLIITVPQFQQAANRLKSHKESMGITTELVFISDIFDGFGYGNKDLTAIRNFIAATYHGGKNLKNVLILGKGTFDYKGKLGGRPNWIPIYTSKSSLDPLTTYSSDDYFAMIDWGQGQWEESKEGDEPLKIGIGRIPAINFREVSAWVDKLLEYEKCEWAGWPESTLTFFSDDGDNSIHMRDAEVHSAFLAKNHPFYRSEKLYLDQFEQVRSGNAQSSPDAKKTFEEILDQGTLVLNYIGHGNETTLTAEEVFQIEDIENWKTRKTLPLWVTATCEFGRHDSPFLRSAAEELLFAEKKGAISLLTTGRPVFSSINFSLNRAFIGEVFKNGEGFGQDLGTIFRNTKNQSLNGPFNRNFSLLGDPSLRLIRPEFSVQVKQLLNRKSMDPVDTIRSLDQLELTGEISDPLSGAQIPGFNGIFRIELWDTPSKEKTRGDENVPFEYEQENSLLFRGEGEVKNGEFTARLIVPELLKKELGKVNLRIFALDSVKNNYAGGIRQIELDGNQKDLNLDREGPKIGIQLQGSGQAGTIFPSRQVELTASFSDESGIYISGENPEKTLRIRINENPPIGINKFYSALEGDFTKGKVTYVLTGLREGTNEVEILAWDNAGNAGKQRITLEVKGSNRLKILEYGSFPNPATELSNFYLRHNRPGENLEGILEVYSLSGQILFSETRRFVKADENIRDWNWIFFQSKSKYPAKGTYIYNLSLKSESGSDSDTVSGKLVIQ